MELTHSLEDYIEAILIISKRKRIVRTKDLMNYFNYKISSVNRAVSVLKEKGLIKHEKYEHIELTKKGEDYAKKIFEKHVILTRFFSETLGISPQNALKDACNVEHYLSQESFEKLSQFIKYLENNHQNIIKEWHELISKNKGRTEMRLSDLNEGEYSIVVKIKGDDKITRKLRDMGVFPGEPIKIVSKEKEAIFIKIDDCSFSIPKKEARSIKVTKVK